MFQKLFNETIINHQLICINGILHVEKLSNKWTVKYLKSFSNELEWSQQILSSRTNSKDQNIAEYQRFESAASKSIKETKIFK